MKPVELKIKGLNSYVKLQEIDFTALSKYSFFGIFGNTGSGKSTIIDAITLSLYGKIPRFDKDSKSRQFINMSTDKAYISFTFAINQNNQIVFYTVERHYKLTSKNTINESKSSLSSFDGENINILADTAKAVTEKVRNIIGMNYDDFTRAVILPQGKFSDFLTLANQERRSMLERIFKLEQYGETLSKKVREVHNELNSKINIIDNSLQIYGDITAQSILDDKKILVEHESNLNLFKSKLINASERLNVLKNTNAKLNELHNYNNKYNELKALKSSFVEKQEVLTKAKNLLSLDPLIKKYEATSEKAFYIESMLKENKIKYEDALSKKQTAELKYNEFLEEKHQLKTLQEQLFKVQEAINLLDEIEVYTAERQKLVDSHKEIKSKIQEFDSGLNKLSEEFTSQKNKLDNIILNRDDLFLEKNYKDNLLLAEKQILKLADLNTSLSIIKPKVETLETEILSTTNKVETLKDSKKNIELETESIQNELDKISTNINHADINKLTVDILERRTRKNIIEENFKKIEENIEQHDSLIFEIKVLKQKTTTNEIEIKQLENHLDDINKSLETIKHAKVLTELQKKLEDGLPCPLCGSLEHPSLTQYDYEDYEEKQKYKDTLLKELENYKIEFSNTNFSINLKNDICKNLTRETEILKSKGSKEEYEELSNILEQLTKKHEDIETNFNETNKLKVNLETALRQKLELLNKTNIDIAICSERIDKNKSLIQDLNKEILELQNSINSFNLEFDKTKQALEEQDNNKILALVEQTKLNDEKIVELNKQEQVLRKNIDKLLLDIDTIKAQKQTEESKLENIVTIGTEIRKNIDRNKQKLDSLNLSDDPKKQIIELKQKIEYINTNEKTVKDSLDIALNNYNQINDKVKSHENELKIYNDLINEQAKELKDNLVKYNMTDLEQAEKYALTESQINDLDKEIDDYKTNVKTVFTYIKNLEDLLANFDTDNIADKINQTTDICEELNESIETTTNNIAVLKQKLNQMEDNISKIESLNKEKSQLVAELDLVDDLNKLFKGTKFIDYVAKKHLVYITFEASNRLKEMTKGRYALELDEAEFVIRDDFNGGIRRTPKTLSGGETFMVSLCLALALSSKIQLNNKNKLNFFFLDEGFGTLDLNSLDDVVNCLEKLRKENLIIGVISHSEELKERIPVKLIVTNSNDNGSVVTLVD